MRIVSALALGGAVAARAATNEAETTPFSEIPAELMTEMFDCTGEGHVPTAVDIEGTMVPLGCTEASACPEAIDGDGYCTVAVNQEGTISVDDEAFPTTVSQVACEGEGNIPLKIHFNSGPHPGFDTASQDIIPGCTDTCDEDLIDVSNFCNLEVHDSLTAETLSDELLALLESAFEPMFGSEGSGSGSEGSGSEGSGSEGSGSGGDDDAAIMELFGCEDDNIPFAVSYADSDFFTPLGCGDPSVCPQTIDEIGCLIAVHQDGEVADDWASSVSALTLDKVACPDGDWPMQVTLGNGAHPLLPYDDSVFIPGCTEVCKPENIETAENGDSFCAVTVEDSFVADEMSDEELAFLAGLAGAGDDEDEEDQTTAPTSISTQTADVLCNGDDAVELRYIPAEVTEINWLGRPVYVSTDCREGDDCDGIVVTQVEGDGAPFWINPEDSNDRRYLRTLDEVGAVMPRVDELCDALESNE